MSQKMSTTVFDLASRNNEQLAAFMAKHRRSERDTVRVGQGELGSTRGFMGSDTTPQSPNYRRADSYSPDVHMVHNRLLEASTGDAQVWTTPPPRENPQTEYPFFTDEELYAMKEIEAYNKLLWEGGRPAYPIHCMEFSAQADAALTDMFRPYWRYDRWSKPWSINTTAKRGIFQTQWQRYGDFRSWQRDNRGIVEGGDRFRVFIDDLKRDLIKDEDFKSLALLEQHLLCFGEPGGQWSKLEKKRKWQSLYQRESGCNRFAEYVSAVKNRLARHGVTDPFNLLEIWEEQDRITTWIEYLCFECWWLDWLAADYEHLKAEYDISWRDLKEAEVAGQLETPESILTPTCDENRRVTRNGAWNALRQAEEEKAKAHSDCSKTEVHWHVLGCYQDTLLEKSKKAKDAYRAAAEAEVCFDKVASFRRTASRYNTAKEDVESQRLLVEWARKQLESIKIERKTHIDGPKRRSAPPTGRLGSSQEAKRQRIVDEDDPELLYSTQLCDVPDSGRRVPAESSSAPFREGQEERSPVNTTSCGREQSLGMHLGERVVGVNSEGQQSHLFSEGWVPTSSADVSHLFGPARAPVVHEDLLSPFQIVSSARAIRNSPADVRDTANQGQFSNFETPRQQVPSNATSTAPEESPDVPALRRSARQRARRGATMNH